MVLRLSILRALAFAALLVVCAPAHAGTVTIEWQRDEAAARVELQVRRDDQVVLLERLPATRTSWTRDLPLGAYTYRLRSFDRSGRAGPWSEATPFVVAPKPPTLLSPADGAIVLGDPALGVKLRWTAVESVRKYAVAIKAEGARTVLRMVEGTQTSVPGLNPGEFTWQVKPVVDSSAKTALAKALGATASPIWRFRIELVKNASAYEDDLQVLRLTIPKAGSRFREKDEACLYDPKRVSRGPLACGVIRAQDDVSITLALTSQSASIGENDQYVLASATTRGSRDLATLSRPENAYVVTSTKRAFGFDVSAGLQAGTGHFFPALQGQARLLGNTTVGGRFVIASDTVPGGDISLKGIYLTVTHYLGPRTYSGLFAEGGVGTYLYSASSALGEQRDRASLAGSLAVGWQFRPQHQGFNVAASLGVQYIEAPKITAVTTTLFGVLPTLSLFLGYAF